MYVITYWDTLDYSTMPLTRKKSRGKARRYVEKHYGDRMDVHGADWVEIRDPRGQIIERYAVR